MKQRIKNSIVSLCICLLAGCACTDSNHMATTNWMDRHIVPDNKTGQWLMTPIIVPVALVTLAIDNFIVAPIAHLPSAYLDADAWCAEPIGGYFSEMGILPLRIVTAPVVFVGATVGRTTFAVEPHERAAWDWPGWGRTWVHDPEGRLLGPATEYDPVTKKPMKDK